MRNLLQLRPATDLRLLLETDLWLAVADAIRRGRCNVQRLTLAMLDRGALSDATETLKAVASAIGLDRNLEHLILKVENGFTDEAGVALVEALTVNTTLRDVNLIDILRPDYHVRNIDTLGTPTYEALSVMLRVNTGLVVGLPKCSTTGGDQRLLESFSQIHIENRLNKVGRGRLLTSCCTTKENWVDALHELSSNEVDESDAFRLSCMFSLFRLNPEVVSMS
jgi:hypothetical protein